MRMVPDRRPHICFVSDTIHSLFDYSYQSAIGGAERQQDIISQSLHEKGYRISLAVNQCAQLESSTIDGREVWEVIPDLTGYRNFPVKLFRTRSGLRQISADIYYVRGNDALSIITALYTTFADAKFVFGVANDANVDPKLLQQKNLERLPFIWALNAADGIIAQTTKQKQLLREEHGLAATQISNGYAIPAENRLVAHEDRNYVLWVGSMDRAQKRPARFLETAKKLPDIEFKMIGPRDEEAPGYYDEIEEQAREIPNLEFVGYVPPDKIHGYYQDAIALVNTSEYEGFPNVFLEAWRWATPIISLYHGLDGVIRNESVGVYAGSMESLIKDIKRLSNNLDLRKKLGYGGREYMKKHFSIEQIANEYERTFSEIYYS